LKRTWEDTKEIMSPGALDALTKELIYVAVSVSNQCNYCIAAHSAAARKKGMTTAIFNELLSVVGLANSNNRLVAGLQVEIDEQFKAQGCVFRAGADRLAAPFTYCFATRPGASSLLNCRVNSRNTASAGPRNPSRRRIKIVSTRASFAGKV